MPTKKLLIIFAILLVARPLDISWRSTVILWNVGQGQFFTWIHNEKCIHFDVGGEKFNSEKLSQICGRRKNEIFLTHFDRDHVSHIPRLLALLEPQKVCLHILPSQRLKADRLRLKWPLNPCSLSDRELLQDLQIIYPTSPFKNENESSVIFVVKKQILVPGDSTRKQELLWRKKLYGWPIHTLVLGHHGSQTSTSEELLQSLSSLKQTWASARRKKYGHPHSSVMNRLKSHGLPLVSTETWGDIIKRLD